MVEATLVTRTVQRVERSSGCPNRSFFSLGFDRNRRDRCGPGRLCIRSGKHSPLHNARGSMAPSPPFSPARAHQAHPSRSFGTERSSTSKGTVPPDSRHRGPRRAGCATALGRVSKAVHRSGNSAAGRRQAVVTRRQGWQMVSWADSGERGVDSAASFDDGWVSGLLAPGLRLFRDARDDHAAERFGSVGAQATRLRAGHTMAIQQHQLRDRRSYR